MKTQTKMPSIFIGHGSPMNALEKNSITKSWQELGQQLPPAQAILVISAHWYISELAITAQAHNQTIHDFYGFPQELATYDYPSVGSPELAQQITEILGNQYQVKQVNNQWGLDHGAWSILTHIYPQPTMPILQLSIDKTKNPQWHYELGIRLRKLREQGVLILASGNIVHNLGQLNWHAPNSGHPWAIEFDQQISNAIIERRFNDVINYVQFGSSARLSVPTPEHFLPLLYILGLADEEDNLQIFNQSYQYGGLSMTSLII